MFVLLFHYKNFHRINAIEIVFKIRLEFIVKTSSLAILSTLIFQKNKIKERPRHGIHAYSIHDRIVRQAKAKMRLRKDNNLTKWLIGCKYRTETREIQSKF
jgi:hypothetical protein